jgi:hypothetical protein
MAQEQGLKRLKVVLMISAVAYLFYGISFLFFPGFLTAISASPEHLGLSWIRWAGGPLLALALGSAMVYRNPVKQGIFVTTSMVSGLLVGLGLLYSWFFDHSTSAAWFHLTPCVINLGIFVLLLWARQGAKEILG